MAAATGVHRRHWSGWRIGGSSHFVPLKVMHTSGGCAARSLSPGLSPAKRAPLVFLFLLLIDGALLAASATTDTILPGEGISGNETLVSKTGSFELGFFSPGPGIHYFLGVRLRNMGHSPTFWLGNRVVITDLPGASLEIFGGSLYIKQNGASLWWTPSPGGNVSSAAVAVLLDNGNLVVRDQRNSSLVLWQSFDYPGDALLPGARLGLDKDTGKNVSLTFKSFSHNGSLSVDVTRRNGFVLTTDGHANLGTFPDWMVSSQDNGSSLRLSHREGPNSTEFLQFHLGQVSLMRYSEPDPDANGTGGWAARWSFPPDCKSGGFFCGDFGACTSSGKCGCVDGFTPSFPIEWGLGYFVTGCSRSVPLSCESDGQTEHGDTFAPLDKLQGLPYNAQGEMAGTDEVCRAACRSKCYCIAYSYGHGCKLWYHKLYNLSLASRPPYSKIYLRLGTKLRNKNGLQTRGIALLVTGLICFASLILIISVLLWRFRRNSFAARKFEVEGPLVAYTYAQIKKATMNFSDKIGQGGFGSVFRGTLPGSTDIAVKNLKVLGEAEKQFRTEVQTVGAIQHNKLVRLLGFCVKGDRRLLVYEYMPNGSLDTHLFPEKSGPLSWNVRYQIALGIAKGLAYLHEECKDCIIHCDIKPENILLDAEFCPKIADFGMAKLLGREFNSALTTMRGTMGYLAPEWLSGLPITKKADVYSFGIVLFEIISGRRSTKMMQFGSHRYFPLYAAAQVNEGEVMCLLDARLEGDANVRELDVLCRVACWCIQDQEDDRPSMGQIVRMLEGVVDIDMPPIPTSLQDLMEGDEPTSLHDLMEGDESDVYSGS
ncbi:G-type lectin S-receptor-like serine/threonine-protein kinase At2g19130 isoform X1 [Hordeum vulgare subsp. vulgare]|uniref:G-type lectin S-receptor-like serine/threonine-protein kinase At2g19130 isoform X1 n=1 Tax=Hordeum vulgare subsp. vulgare TaxID=112509 RepID=UPI00029544CE|nr:G-type lectin S-receptor-like serine/threonine-protein kinase At2g19130 isoform X1 [Hordeum vulgare subsp. vulgare]